jgi:transcription-repair coupling factor (superfamily II helicase)
VVFIRALDTVAERLKETTAILRDLAKLAARRKAA